MVSLRHKIQRRHPVTQLSLLWQASNDYITGMTGEIIIFILVCLALGALAVAAIFTPMLHRAAAKSDPSTDIDFYRSQYDEVDRDLDRGVLDVAEAERARLEISRRLVATDKAGPADTSDAPRGLTRAVIVVCAIALLGSTGVIYWKLGALGYGDVPRLARIEAGEERRTNRPSQQAAEQANPETDAISQADDATREILQALRAAVFERPDEIQAWAYLAQTEASIGNMQRAARAQEETLSMLGDNARDGDYIRLLDFLVIGARGYVSPEAEAIALMVLQNDDTNTAALYYAGLMYAQNDRPDRAFSLWRRVVEGSDQDSIHWDFAAGQIRDVATQVGLDYALPTQRGPTADDLDAAQDMAPADRQAMIQGMVTQLADRLATEGGPAQDWARLISSLAVLGEVDAALQVLNEAELTFGGDVQAVNILRRAAQDAGLTQ